MLAVPDWGLIGTLGTFGSIPEGIFGWAVDANLINEVIEVIFRAGLAGQSCEVPEVGKIAFEAFLSIVVGIGWWTLTYFVDIMFK